MDNNLHFEQSVDRFIQLQRRKRIVSASRDLSVLDMVEQLEPLSVEQVKEGFDLLDQEMPDAKFFLKQVRECFMDSVRALNQLNPSRRLYALETFNYLGNLNNISLTTETLLFAEDKSINPIALSFLSTFRGTDQVITTLSKHGELFIHESKEKQVRALFAFRADMAEQLLSLLSQDYVLAEAAKAKIDVDLSLDLIRSILKSSNPHTLVQNLVKGQQLSINLAKLIAFTQGHKLMPIYAKKRNDFMKQFLNDLASVTKIDGVTPRDMSKVVSCFLYTNEQCKPPESLIAMMLDEDEFDQETTFNARQDFLNQLAPTTVDVILKDLRDFLHILTSSPLHDIEEAFEIAKQKHEAGLSNESSLLGRFHDAIMDMKIAGHNAIDNISHFAKKLKAALLRPSEEDSPERNIDTLFDEMPDVSNIEEYRAILRDPGAKERAIEYVPVQTTTIGYRSEKADGGKRGASVNLHLFKSVEHLQCFKPAFLALLKQLKKQAASMVITNEFKHPQANHTVHEYYIPLLIPMEGDDPLLCCIGISYFEKDLKMMKDNQSDQHIADSYMDPYCFLMHTKNSDTTMNARSRKLSTAVANLQGQEFKSINIRNPAYGQACLSILLDLLHLIDESIWESKSVQVLVSFLYQELKLTPEYY